MHEDDTAFKTLLQGSESSILKQITGADLGRWLNVELPNVQQTRVDLLFKTLEEADRLAYTGRCDSLGGRTYAAFRRYYGK